MAQIGHGYGSEFHLMRFMGHHRELLEQVISDALGEKGTFHWLDFGFVPPMSSISGDRELKGFAFLKELVQKEKYESFIMSTIAIRLERLIHGRIGMPYLS